MSVVIIPLETMEIISLIKCKSTHWKSNYCKRPPLFTTKFQGWIIALLSYTEGFSIIHRTQNNSKVHILNDDQSASYQCLLVQIPSHSSITIFISLKHMSKPNPTPWLLEQSIFFLLTSFFQSQLHINSKNRHEEIPALTILPCAMLRK